MIFTPISSTTELTTQILTLLCELIRRPSITPHDAGCQQLLADQLLPLGFHATWYPCGDVLNLWLTHGQGEPVMIFAGHTDVVPPGDSIYWHSDPFNPSVRDGFLYGRGAADMKSGLSAMVGALAHFVIKNPKHVGTVGLLVTSDEEGLAKDGTQFVLKKLQAQGQALTYCVVGEATSENYLGDMYRIGRRGSLSATLKIYGKQGHVAYPERAKNPIHAAFGALDELTHTTWDNGLAEFSATSLQISNIHAGTGANNVIPADLDVLFNFRYSPASKAQVLSTRVANILTQHGLTYSINWHHGGQPYYTEVGELRQACHEAIASVTNRMPCGNTIGGTSDGRFIAQTGCQVIEFGPVNYSIHQSNEYVRIEDLAPLCQIYLKILEKVDTWCRLATCSRDPNF